MKPTPFWRVFLASIGCVILSGFVDMAKFATRFFVSVALLTMISPALASHGTSKPSPSPADYTAFYGGHYGPLHDGYWTESHEYYSSAADNRPYGRDDGRRFRKVMVTGFHPAEGFGPAPLRPEDASRF